jgi:hypothetical protein
MRAIRLPYPSPQNKHPWASWQQMRRLEMVVDFPERNVSYVIFGDGPKFDVQRCADEVKKSVSLQTPGKEPKVLEIRISD